MKKRILALLLAFALLGSLPVSAAESEAPARDDLFALGAASELGHIALADVPAEEEYTFTVSARRAMSVAGGPTSDGATGTSYDPRGSGILTAVRDQGSWNTCWAMAAMAAAETDGLKSSLLSTGAANTDLSERHLIYFLSHRAADPLGNSSGDYNINPSFWIQSGGNPQLATMTMASWHGAAAESATSSPYSGLSTSDSLSASYAYTDVLHLENTYAMDVATDAGREALKSMIREHGGAVLCLYFNPSRYTNYLFAGSPSAVKATPTPASTPTPTPTATDAAETPDPLENPTIDAAEGSEEPLPVPAPGESTPAPVPAEESAPVPAEETPLPAETGTEPASPVPDAEPEEEAGEPDPLPTGADSAEGEATDGDAPEIAGLDGAADAAAAGLFLNDGAARPADYTVCYYLDPVTYQEEIRLTKSGTTHEMLIVGWDDNYPAENFSFSPRGAAPAKNGAWLCRNSYGSNWGDGGYVWVSYYDASVSYSTNGSISARVTVFDFGSDGNYDHNYEYDGAAILGYVNDTVNGKGVSTQSASSGTRRWYANIFTASGNSAARGSETLKAVSTYTYAPGVPYTVEIYKNLKSTASPTGGTLAATASGTFPYAGFHTVVLPKTVSLAEGEIYSVVFRVGAASDNSVFVPSCYTSPRWYSVNESKAGQSFVSLDGSSWLDCYDLSDSPNVRIKAYTDDAAPVLPFTDVAKSSWYYSDVEASWLKGLVNGMSATTYEPNGTATRAQVVTTLWRMAGQPAPKKAAAYPDVVKNTWYTDAVAWASENGIVTGYTNGLFRPAATITRQELMTVLHRYAKLKGMNTSQTTSLASFKDSGSVGAWAKDAVVWSVASGLQNGVASASGTKLEPSGNVTRAQLAAFLNRFSQMK